MNKPYLFFAEHFFAIHQVDIMYSEYHLCIGIQFIIKHGNYRSGQFKVNAAVQFVHDKNSALLNSLYDITCKGSNLFCSRRVKKYTGNRNPSINGYQSDLIHNLFGDIKSLFLRFLLVRIHFYANILHIHIFKIIHIQVRILDELHYFPLKIILIFHEVDGTF